MKVFRPVINPDTFSRLESYLLEQWKRAVDARRTQVDDKFADWNNNYYGIPREKTRTLPWYGSSNFVVKIVRLFVETFAARTLNIIFATNPLIRVGVGFDREVREALQYYLDHKAQTDWEFYSLFNQMLIRGPKNGSVFVKVTHHEEMETAVDLEGQEHEVDVYVGPRARVIPFDDFYVYPITACDLSAVEIKFHRVRYTETAAEERVTDGRWGLSSDEVKSAARRPDDIKRADEREVVGIYDSDLREVQMVECYLKYAVTNDPSRIYSIVAVICPELNKLVDVYFDPAPANYPTFYQYSPSPREDCLFGESWSEVLGQSQEEVSSIHNERRNSSYLASAPVFKRKAGAGVPNPSTNWYPGKVFDVDSLDDLDVLTLGRSTQDMIAEELHSIALAERLMGIGPVMQGMSMGSQDKRGIYNTGGVMAVMSEGNQRQDTNIRDARMVLSSIAKCCYFFQAHLAPRDPFLEMISPEIAEKVRAAFAVTTRDRMRNCMFEIKASSAGANSETEKASLMQMSNFLSQHSKTLLELTPQLVSNQNPQLRGMIMSIMNLSSWMAKRLLSTYGELDTEGVLPDVRQILSPEQPQGGNTNTGEAVGPELLQRVAALGPAASRAS